MKKIINKKNVIIISLFLIVLILLIISSIFHFKIPIDYSNGNNVSEVLEIEENTEITFDFISKIDDLGSISILITGAPNIKEGEIYVSIYDENDELIFYNDLSKADYLNSECYNLYFDRINDSIGKKYKLVIETNEFRDNTSLKIRQTTNDLDFDTTIINGETQTNNIATIQYGYSETWFYKIFFVIIILILVVIFVRLNFNYFENIRTILLSKYKLFIIEFILSFITIFSAYKCIVCSYYYDYFTCLYFIIFLIFSILLIMLISIFIGYKKLKKEQLFLLLAIPIGLMYFIFLLPLSEPDAYFHYKIAYRITSSNVLSNLVYYPRFNFNNYLNLDNALNGSIVEIIDESSGGGYNPILYIFSSFGVLVGKLLSLPSIAGVYLGVFCNFLVFLIVGYYAVKKIPFAKILLIVYMFNPMFLNQAISFSCDAMINIFSILYISYIMYIYYDKKKIDKKDFIIICLSLTFVLMGKHGAYFLFLLLLILIYKPLKEFISQNKKIAFISLLMLILIVLGWSIFTKLFWKSSTSISKINVPQEIETKMQHFLKNPLYFISIFFKTIYYRLEDYILMFSGNLLGALNITINKIYTIFYLIILFISSIADNTNKQLDKKNKIINVIIFVLTFGIILFALYNGWGIINDVIIQGVQGRYFIPIVILLLLILPSKKIKFYNCDKFISYSLIILHIFIITNVITHFLV